VYVNQVGGNDELVFAGAVVMDGAAGLLQMPCAFLWRCGRAKRGAEPVVPVRRAARRAEPSDVFGCCGWGLATTPAMWLSSGLLGLARDDSACRRDRAARAGPRGGLLMPLLQLRGLARLHRPGAQGSDTGIRYVAIAVLMERFDGLSGPCRAHRLALTAENCNRGSSGNPDEWRWATAGSCCCRQQVGVAGGVTDLTATDDGGLAVIGVSQNTCLLCAWLDSR